VAAYRARLLTGPAALLAGGLAASIVGLGGGAYAVPSLLFFGSSAALSRLRRSKSTKRCSPAEHPAEEARRRDAWQVLANGSVAWLLLGAAPWIGGVLCFWGFVGAFAAAAADTWATEIGGRFGGAPRSLRTLRLVAAGASGAVSGAGTLAALAGAALVSVGAAPFAHHFLPADDPALVAVLAAVLVATGAGFLGALADSLAGAFLQARFREAQTGRWTEAPVTEGRRNRRVRGLRFLGNDGVNVLCTIVGATAAMLGVHLL
jgi:uncharacterized protein (TIGR00297 family)